MMPCKDNGWKSKAQILPCSGITSPVVFGRLLRQVLHILKTYRQTLRTGMSNARGTRLRGERMKEQDMALALTGLTLQ